MAKVASVNVDCATNGGPDAIWNLVNLLLSNGWTRLADSNGVTSSVGPYPPGVAQVTSGTTLNVSRAYIVLEDPAGTRKLFFQRGSGGANAWWIRYSRSGSLTPGANPAIDMPTTADIRDVFGTTNAGSTLFQAATNFYGHAVFETTPANTVYQFWFAATVKVSGALQGGGFMLGADTTVVSGGLDQDPAVMKIDGTDQWVGNGNQRMFTSYPTLASWTTNGSRFQPGNIASPNAFTGQDDNLPSLIFMAGSNTAPFKGQNTWMRTALVQRAYPNTINLNTDCYVYFFGNFTYILLPWPNTITPQL